MENRKIIGLIGLLVLVLAIGYYTWDGRNPTSISRAALYHDQILVNNNYMLVKKDGDWVKPERDLFLTLKKMIWEGEYLAPETEQIPAEAIEFKMIYNNVWDALCYIDPESGIVYLSQVMEGKEETKFTRVFISKEAVSQLFTQWSK